MPNSTPKIVVAGDVSIDWLAFSVDAHDPVPTDGRMPFNWQLQTGTRMFARHGGALLLAQMTGLATEAEIITHHLTDLENIPPHKIIHSIAELERFPLSSDKKDEKNLVYRVKRFCGFSGPVAGATEPLPVRNDDAGADFVILDDAGNGFRDAEAVWPAALGTEGRQPVVIFKLSRPLFQGKLWDTVRKAHAERLVVVVRADDLRAEGVNISRRLSWERTATDFVWQMACNSRLISLAGVRHLVVTFGLDGAMHCTRRDGRIESRLYYDPAVVEDGFRDDCPGEMLGLTSAFVAALTARIVKEGLEAVGEGVRDGLGCARRLFRQGFGTDPAQDHLSADLFLEQQVATAPCTVASEQPYIAEVMVPHPAPLQSIKQPQSPNPADQKFWRILEGLKGLEEIAYEFVRDGQAAALKSVPVGRFGQLKTVDRAEIESFRSIRNLMREYLKKTDATRPLSIAVFGPPGSGKSFGVTEVAESLAPNSTGSGSDSPPESRMLLSQKKVKVERREFNLAQFTSIADLTSALHQVRDIALSGNIPLIFFDEFDATFNNSKLGWLKYFLAPMQDGKFKDGETMHPVGKAIFVFAGGTSETYEKFCGEGSEDKPPANLPAYSKAEFKAAKGPDFVSRLRGYVNILGINQVNERDNFWIIRRALLLRSLLDRKAKHIFSGSGRANLDAGVLRALLKVPEYKHGARSMEAIIEMSLLSGRKSFEPAALPPAEQLALHVDAEWFSRLVIRDVLLGSAREVMAQAIHEQFLKEQKGKKPDDDPAMLSWEKLSEAFAESNRQQADQIPVKLRSIGCSFSPVVGREPVAIEFTDEEVEKMAKLEHERFVAERHLAGWSVGPRMPGQMTNPTLVDWTELPESEKDKDRQTVRAMPKFLAGVGFEIYRL